MPKKKSVERRIFDHIVKMGYFDRCNGDWELFSKTFAWFSAGNSLAAKQKTEVERLWKEKRSVSSTDRIPPSEGDDPGSNPGRIIS